MWEIESTIFNNKKVPPPHIKKAADAHGVASDQTIIKKIKKIKSSWVLKPESERETRDNRDAHNPTTAQRLLITSRFSVMLRCVTCSLSQDNFSWMAFTSTLAPSYPGDSFLFFILFFSRTNLSRSAFQRLMHRVGSSCTALPIAFHVAIVVLLFLRDGHALSYRRRCLRTSAESRSSKSSIALPFALDFAVSQFRTHPREFRVGW